MIMLTRVGVAIAALLSWSAAVHAHELDCEKFAEIVKENDKYLIGLDGWDPAWMTNGATLRYTLVVKNVADAPSVVKVLIDPLLEYPPGRLDAFEFDPKPAFTLDEYEEQVYYYDVEYFTPDVCRELDCADGYQDGRVLNTFTVAWDGGFKTCHTLTKCAERKPAPALPLP